MQDARKREREMDEKVTGWVKLNRLGTANHQRHPSKTAKSNTFVLLFFLIFHFLGGFILCISIFFFPQFDINFSHTINFRNFRNTVLTIKTGFLHFMGTIIFFYWLLGSHFNNCDPQKGRDTSKTSFYRDQKK